MVIGAKINDPEKYKASPNGNDSHSSRLLIRLGWGEKTRLTFAFWLMGISALSTAGYAYLVGPVMRRLFTGQAPSPSTVPSSEFIIALSDFTSSLTVEALAVLLVAVAGLKAIAFFGQTVLLGHAGAHILHTLRDRFYRSLLQLNPFSSAASSSGDLVARFTTDVDHVEAAISKGWVAAVRYALEFAALAGLAISLDPVLAIMGLVGVPPAALLIIRIGKSVRSERAAVHHSTGNMGKAVEETVAGLPIIRSFGAEPLMASRFGAHSLDILKAAARAVAARAVSSPMNELLATVALALTLVYATTQIAQGELAPESFISFFTALLLLYQPIKGLGKAHHAVQAGKAALARIAPFIEQQANPPPESPNGDSALESIRLVHATTGYEDNKNVIEDVSLTVKPGEKIAIVGRSGGGKSTLLNLLEGLLPIRAGEILLNKTPLVPEQARHVFATVRQEPFLFDDTIAMNIRVGRPDATDQEVAEVALTSGVTEFARKLEAGLETPVGVLGRTLSVGQRQRVCLARAIISPAPVLLLDEVTASLDGKTERSIVDGLDSVLRNRTVLVVTHRLSTAQWADRLLLIEKGRILRDGPAKALTQSDPKLTDLFGEQLSGKRS